MYKPEIPYNEDRRLEALDAYKILDTLPEEEYDALTKIAAEICGTPIALVTLVDHTRQWFKSHHGLNATETPRDFAFCAHTINTPDELFIIPDATKDKRFYDNPLTTNDPHVIFYAGAPLNSKDGYSLGTICVIDTKPREGGLTDSQKESLKALANQVISQFELRKKNSLLESLNNEILEKNVQLNQFAYRLTHDLKVPIQGVNSLITFIKEDHKELIKNTTLEEWIDLIYSRNEYMEFLINGILEYTKVSNEKICFEYFNVLETIQYILDNNTLHIPVHIDYINCDVLIRFSKISFIQIIQNLLSNTVKHTDEPKSNVWISLEENETSYSFIYEDDGPGIQEEYWQKVFELFETVSPKYTKNSGIGLSTIKAVVERLGGAIYLKNRENNKKGACFCFVLPREYNC
ncbi:GAF domain-containing sensor histidine kinase [Flavobacterium sp. MC2016-06]|jgi:signal transduction histidine kinase|uniref:sensor histidine kinase n=1 Tax=Flavobacterium sp. MC2016-06 TaxID=2676308 RepID=UPI0012BB059F|nr:GAF domain-containing sensor histidine kinase [Flavobacterium sp. MC2016-06]MBU3857694.1 GAF domain-containing sensor histidine kinase [Flavobacterium sp. MC2016-06]